MVLLRSPDWMERVQRIIAEFNDRAMDLYDDEGRRNGGIEAEDRYGVPRFFPFVTLGVGALTVTPSYASASARRTSRRPPRTSSTRSSMGTCRW